MYLKEMRECPICKGVIINKFTHIKLIIPDCNRFPR